MFDGIIKAEKKVLRVIKWLERCAAACRAGSSESALMDMECARADLDNAREALWEVNGRKYAQAPTLTWAKVAFSAAIILLFAAAPISMLEVVVVNSEAAFPEWVTPDEKILLTKLRSRFVESNLADIRTNRPQERSAQRVQPLEISPVNENKEQNKIDDAKMLYLIKTGERALRNDQVVVKVEKRQ